jgi:DNA-directed RNA polymerase beta' subunit
MASAPVLHRIVSFRGKMISPEDVRRGSCLEIKHPDDLNSQRLGVQKYDWACETCGNFMEECPGHFGHIELPLPVPKIMVLSNLVDVLNCICVFCQQPRLPIDHDLYALVSSLPPEQRLAEAVQSSRKLKRCSTKLADPEHTHPSEIQQGCGRLLPTFAVEDKTFLVCTYSVTSTQVRSPESDPVLRELDKMEIDPNRVILALSFLPPATRHFLGLQDHRDLSGLMWEALLVPSHNTRPKHTLNGVGPGKKQFFNDITKHLRVIFKSSEELRNLLLTSSVRVVNLLRIKHRTRLYTSVADLVAGKEYNSSTYAFHPVETAWRALCRNIAMFHSNKHGKMGSGKVWGAGKKTADECFRNQKDGELRKYNVSRRVSFCVRAVVEGTLELFPDEIGLSKKHCMQLTIPEYVSDQNAQQVQGLVVRGPYEYPGANSVVYLDGREVDLRYGTSNRRDIDLNQVLFVRRHVRSGDVVMVNRQPTLHLQSLWCFTVRVWAHDVTYMHPSIFPPMAADCDGDEVTVHVLQTFAARVAARELCSVSNCLFKDGRLQLKFIQNAVMGAHFLTAHPGRRLRRRDASLLLGHLEEVWDLPDEDFQWTGHDVVARLFPHELLVDTVNAEGERVLLRRGELSGRVDAKALNGPRGLLAELARDPDLCVHFMRVIKEGYLLFQQAVDLVGVSAGPDDLSLHNPRDLVFPHRRAAHERVGFVRSVLVERAENFAQTHPGCDIRPLVEKLSTATEQGVWAYHLSRRTNKLLDVVRSGAKGDRGCISQLCGAIGFVGAGDRHEGSLSERGYLTHSFDEGMDAEDLLRQAPANARGIMWKNKGTALSGEMMRQMAYGNMCHRVDYLGQVIDAGDRVLQDVYGGDGWNPAYLVVVRVEPFACPAEAHREPLPANAEWQRARLAELDSPGTYRFPVDCAKLLEWAQLEHGGGPGLELLDYADFAPVLWRLCVAHGLVPGSSRAFEYWFLSVFFYRALERARLGRAGLLFIARKVEAGLRRALVVPGQPVGLEAAFAIGEPLTQSCLKAPHQNVQSGSDHFRDLLKANFKNAAMTVPLQVGSRKEAEVVGLGLIETYVRDVIRGVVRVEHLPGRSVFFFQLDRERTIARCVSLRCAARRLRQDLGLDAGAVEWCQAPRSDWWFRVSLDHAGDVWLAVSKAAGTEDVERVGLNLAYNLRNHTLLSGLVGITGFSVTEEPAVGFSLVTSGSDLMAVLQLSDPRILYRLVTSTDARQVLDVYGLDAARRVLLQEMQKSLGSESLDPRHLWLVVHTMTSSGRILGFKQDGVGQRNTFFQRATHGRAVQNIVQACLHSETEVINNPSSAAFSNSCVDIGTHFQTELLHAPQPVRPETRIQFCDYVIASKVDGCRYMLVFCLVEGRTAVCLLDRGASVFEVQHQTHPSTQREVFCGSVLDGDLAVSSSGEYCFRAYDCLMSSGNPCSHLRYDQRLEIARTVLLALGVPQATVQLTRTRCAPLPTSTPLPMFAMHRYLDLPFFLNVKPVYGIEHLTTFYLEPDDFPRDGLIFTKLSAAAAPYRNEPANIFKHKTSQDSLDPNTVDFLLRPCDRRVSDGDEFRACRGFVGLHVLHGKHSTELFASTKEQKTTLQCGTEIYFNSVYECAWDHTSKMWVVVRYRRKQANTLETALACVNNIRENLSPEQVVALIGGA